MVQFVYRHEPQVTDNVAIEQLLDLGVRVDAVVRRIDDFSFYELKIAPSVQACMRDALGQLLEYAYWPDASRACQLVVVGEHTPDAADRTYLELLRSRFNLPIFYRRLTLNPATLGPMV